MRTQPASLLSHSVVVATTRSFYRFARCRAGKGLIEPRKPGDAARETAPAKTSPGLHPLSGEGPSGRSFRPSAPLAIFRRLFLWSWRLSARAVGRHRAEIPRLGRTQLRAANRTGHLIYAAADPDFGLAQSAASALRPCARAPVRVVCAGLGVVAVGLDQGRADLSVVRHDCGLGSLRRDSAQPAALVVLLLAGVAAHHCIRGVSGTAVGRAAVLQVSATGGAPAAACGGDRTSDPARRA